MEWEEKEKIKEEYAGGTEYFLFTGDIYPPDHLITLLKAFSYFKKWQQSNMKLIMAGPANRKTEKLKEKLATYKYREDVIIIENPDPQTIQELTGAAYAPVSIDQPETVLAKHLVSLYKER
jgi:glycosyltransferase involved in cell wall biosynthesis